MVDKREGRREELNISETPLNVRALFSTVGLTSRTTLQ